MNEEFTGQVDGWLPLVLEAEQRSADHKFEEKKALFARQSAEWIDNNMRNRETGGPTAIVPFAFPIPTRTVFFATSHNTYSQKEVVDESLKLPVLPPPVKVLPTVIVGTSAPTADANRDQMIAMILSTLMAIKSKLGL